MKIEEARPIIVGRMSFRKHYACLLDFLSVFITPNTLPQGTFVMLIFFVFVCLLTVLKKVQNHIKHKISYNKIDININYNTQVQTKVPKLYRTLNTTHRQTYIPK